jgi:hypothetical protein
MLHNLCFVTQVMYNIAIVRISAVCLSATYLLMAYIVAAPVFLLLLVGFTW